MPSQSVFNTKDGAVYTTSNGAPVAEPYAAGKVGPAGPLLLEDFHHIDLLAHFDRERIPERVVHAKGAGAHGYFEVTDDITDLTCAAFLNKVGNKSDLTIRFSTVGGESGSADTARDPRGFAIKIRTSEGNLDWVFNNTPVFFIRDPAKFPHFIHTQKRDPQTHLKDPDMFWDYLSQNPESIHQVCILFSDRGTPDGYHKMHGYSGHTFKFVKEDGSYVYTRIHARVRGGFRTLSAEKAAELSGSNPDYGIQALFEAIEKQDYPTWDVYAQIMTTEQASKFRYNPFDLTKVWSHKEYPLRRFGKMVLNKNVENYFAEIEQAAFSPSHTVPGWAPSADPVLQSRLFSYPDTHRHRLGVNYQQIPVNQPIVPVANFQRDGYSTIISQKSRPNYQSSIQPLTYKQRISYDVKHEKFIGHALIHLTEINELDFEQPRALYTKVFSETDRENFIKNVAGHLGSAQSVEVKQRQLAVFGAVDKTLGEKLAKAIGLEPVEPLKVKPADNSWKYNASLA